MTANRPPTKPRKRIYRTYYTDNIRTIYEKVIRPTLKELAYKESERALDEGIRRFFHTDTRSVYFARAISDFTIPGKEWVSLVAKYLRYNGSVREVVAGDGLVVRIDEYPGDSKVDIEFGEAVFTMTIKQYEKVAHAIELVG